MTKREARKWVRGHWAGLMRTGTMPDLPPEYDDAISSVWGDECNRIANRIDPEHWTNDR